MTGTPLDFAPGRRTRRGALLAAAAAALLATRAGGAPLSDPEHMASSRENYELPRTDPWLRDLVREAPNAQYAFEPAGGAPTAADPVVAPEGEFTLAVVDLALGGPMSLGFGRYFGSNTEISAFLWATRGYGASEAGFNWLHNFEVSARYLGSDTVAVSFLQGKPLFFTRQGDGSWLLDQPGSLAKGTPYQLAESGTTLRLLDPTSQWVHTFDTTVVNAGSSFPVQTIEDRNGNRVTVTHDPYGTTLRAADGLGRTLDFTSEYVGGIPRLTRVTDQSGRHVDFTYDESGRPLTATDASGKTTSYAYDAEGAVTTVTSPRGNAVVTNVYDLSGRVTSQADGRGRTTTFSYLASSTTITDPSGNATVQDYGPTRRLLGFTDAAGRSRQFTYDASGRPRGGPPPRGGAPPGPAPPPGGRRGRRPPPIARPGPPRSPTTRRRASCPRAPTARGARGPTRTPRSRRTASRSATSCGSTTRTAPTRRSATTRPAT